MPSARAAAAVAILALVAVGCATSPGSAESPGSAGSGSPDDTPTSASTTPVPSSPASPSALRSVSLGPVGPASESPSATRTRTDAGSELRAELDRATSVDPADYAGTVTEVGFQSPSGNITCGFTERNAGGTRTGVTCQISEFSFRSPASNCHGGGNGGAVVLRPPAKPSFTCLGGVESGGPTLPYGSKIRVSGVTCASQSDGVTCLDARGHGFRLAKQYYVLA